jgi:hypothetical protein
MPACLKCADLPTPATQTWRLLMIDDSKVTKDDANGVEPAAPRILARQLARPLTEDELDHVTGGTIHHDTHSGTGCPENDSDA